MSNSYRIAAPYLRMMLHAEDAVAQNLPRPLIAEIETAMKADYIDGNLINRIFEAVAELGLTSWISHYGNQLGVGSHGPTGFAALSAPNLLTALKVFAEYGDIRSSGTNATVQIEADRLNYIVTDNTEHALAGPWLIESNFLVAQKLIETIMAHTLGTNSRFDFTCTRRPHHAAVESLLNAACHYQQKQNCLSIPASWAAMPSPLSDEGSYRSNLAKSREIKIEINRDRNNVAHFVDSRLRSHFDRRLGSIEATTQTPDLQLLADEMAMSKRTLIRKLARQNTSFKTILESLREELAKMLLLNTHLTAAEIGAKLGYLEAANFGRAFRRWTGTTPTVWRRRKSNHTTAK